MPLRTPRREWSNGRRFALDNDCGRVVTEDSNRARSLTSRLCEQHMAPYNVCDAQYPVHRPCCGPQIDVTVAAIPFLWFCLKALGQRFRRF